ncbi:MAG: hydroxymethylbilane synthase [Pseudomonadota bacterium]
MTATPPTAHAAADARTVRIGTRGSPLALVQARQVAAALETLSGGALRGEIVVFKTSGDLLTTERLINAGGKGLFTKEIDQALDEGQVDLAVHSLKDVPSALPDGQIFVAMPEREDPRDGFLSPIAETLDDLPVGAVVGTASLRREAQALARRPDLKTVSFRGKVETRVRKLEEGQADATFLAMAGLSRLGLSNLARPIEPEDMLPAACQGVIGVAGRPDALSAEILAAAEKMTHPPSRRAALAERAFLAQLDGSCRTPIAAHLCADGDTLHFRGEALSPDGARRWTFEERITADADDTALESLGRAAAAAIRAEAGGDLPTYEDL